ncbi:MAG: PorP/SprF family type IX secretion system membrane protein [Bacteroidales bacterium]|jgi:type IX secretion system PorP/SprF family membrane protein|nr:PorP/SprF family type IX secretion system membrane protein [Bacteroidales bacterium]
MIFIGWLIAVFVGQFQPLKAQSDAFLTQQWLSRININPAATGNSQYLDVYALIRSQWTGFENAPKTQTLNIHNYFHRIQSGLGLTATHDKIGVGLNNINAKLAYAYHVNLGVNWLLSLGLSGGIYQQRSDPSKNYVNPGQDQDYLLEKQSLLHPDVDFGIELNSARFQFGASVTHLLNISALSISKKTQVRQQYYAYMSYKQPVTEKLELVLGTRGTNFDYAPYIDLSLTGIVSKTVWLGVAYRAQNLDRLMKPAAVVGMVGVQIAFLRLGYSYDYSLGNIRNIAQGSHELMVSLKINKPKKEIHTKSPRFIED